MEEMRVSPDEISKVLTKIAEENPLSYGYEEDARYTWPTRYTWPNRWNALRSWLKRLSENKIEGENQ